MGSEMCIRDRGVFGPFLGQGWLVRRRSDGCPRAGKTPNTGKHPKLATTSGDCRLRFGALDSALIPRWKVLVMLNSHRFLLPTVLGVTVHLVQIGCGPRVARPRTAAEPHDSEISAEEVKEAVSVVEEFLAAAAGSDLEGMARLFGTAEGPAHRSTTPYEIQQRIFIMARLLAYDSMYVEPSAVPATAGRVRVTARLFGRREQPLETKHLSLIHISEPTRPY